MEVAFWKTFIQLSRSCNTEVPLKIVGTFLSDTYKKAKMVFIDTWLLKMAISYFFLFLNNKSVNPITTWACSNTTPLHSISKTTVTPSHDLTFIPNAHGKLRHSKKRKKKEENDGVSIHDPPSSGISLAAER